MRRKTITQQILHNKNFRKKRYKSTVVLAYKLLNTLKTLGYSLIFGIFSIVACQKRQRL